MGAACRDTLQGHTGTPEPWCPRGGCGRSHEVTLRVRVPCTSNHRLPLAGAGTASTGAAKRMRDGATEPAEPPGTRWPGMPGHGTVTTPAATTPVLGGPSDPQKNQPNAAWRDPDGARLHPALPHAPAVCNGCCRESHREPAEMNCSQLGLGTQPFPGSPRLTSPRGQHHPMASITPRLASALPPFRGQPVLPEPCAWCWGVGAGGEVGWRPTASA